MSTNERVLYPMLGVGAFFALFWTGFVVAYELGWTCNAMLVNGLLFGGLGSYFVARLEAYDSRGSRAAPHQPPEKLPGMVDGAARRCSASRI